MKLILFFVLLTSISVCWSETISGTISFDKRVPEASLIYIHGNSTQPLNGQLDQKNKAFVSKIVAASPDSIFSFSNSDDINHNIFAKDKSSAATFDIGLMKSGDKVDIDVNWTAGTLVKIGCKIHPRMRAYIANINASHHQILTFTKSRKEYDFSIDPSDQKAVEIGILIPGYAPINFTLEAGKSRVIELLRRGKRRGEISIAFGAGD